MKNFEKAIPKPSFPEIDREVIDYWEKNDVFKRTSTKKAPKGNFIFFEGPPTANGRPGIHHVLSRVFKDIIPRYKTMQGYRVDRKGGWDTHGLPVEIEVEKNLGISGKKQIEDYGIEKFNKKCRESVWKYVKEWEELTRQIGFWLDMEDAYITYDPKYIESLWWILGEAWKKDLLYEGFKVVPYCPRCGTALSSHEIAQGYREIEEESIYVKFPVAGEKNTYFLVWTTTPWTLVGNSGLAFGENITYVKAEVKKLQGSAKELVDTGRQESEYYILAKDKLEATLLDKSKKTYTILGTEELSGKEIIARYSKEGSDYVPPYKEGVGFKQEPGTKQYKLIFGDFVTTEDGTGIVHIAPAFGEDDYQNGRIKNNLAVLLTVNEDGIVLAGPGKGKFVKDADPEIITNLQNGKQNLLFYKEKHTHTYPFCWRCDTPLIYYARNTWFIRMSQLRNELVENNKQVQWYPANLKEGRFGEWIREAKDWALSRERYWGTPLPIWKCEKCGKKEIITSYREIFEKTGQEERAGFDPHRPFIDAIRWECDCGGRYERYPLVLDCWFDSGSMPLAQWGYPYQPKSEEKFNNHFPADFICEAIDQTRGWFYTLLAISTLLEKGPAYKHVISLGHILDEAGQKMSKSKGNVVNPMEVLSTHGADATRWYMYGATTAGNPRNFSIKLVGESKRFLITFWNVYSFFVTYASVDGYQPGKADNEKEVTNPLDRWILSRKNKLIEKVTKHLDRYNIYRATEEIEGFLDDLSNWYVRRSRRRFWKSENDSDKTIAYDTLYNILIDFTKILAPFMPFVSEKVFQNLSLEKISVHLSDWPIINKMEVNETLEFEMKIVRKLVERGLNLRNEAGIKIRQPLAKLKYGGDKLPVELEKIIIEEVNVKEIGYDSKLKKDLILDTVITKELKAEGMARDIIRQIQEMRKKSGLEVENRIILYWGAKQEDIQKVMEDYADYIKREVLAVSMEKIENENEPRGYGETFKVDSKEIFLSVEKTK